MVYLNKNVTIIPLCENGLNILIKIEEKIKVIFRPVHKFSLKERLKG
jgi:hypothetical protein